MASNLSVGLRQDKAIKDIKQALSAVVTELGIEAVSTEYNGVKSEYPLFPSDGSMFSPKHPNAPTISYVALLELIRIQSLAIENMHTRLVRLGIYA